MDKLDTQSSTEIVDEISAEETKEVQDGVKEVSDKSTNADTEKVDSKEDSSEKEADKENKPNFNKEALLADLHKERTNRKAYQSQVAELQVKLEQLQEVSAQHEQLQKKYDRLEAFIIQSKSSIAKALDSRRFVKSLFESDTDIEEIIKQWYKDNPTATSKALGANSNQINSGINMNELIRTAYSC